MRPLITTRQKKQYDQFTTQVTIDIGRQVSLRIPGTKISCPNCVHDPINKRSANVFSPKNPFPTGLTGYDGSIVAKPFFGICPWCNGTGYITTGDVIKTVQCLVRWLNTGEEKFLIQGMMAENDVRLKCDIKFKSSFEAAKAVVVDGSIFQVKQIVPGGLGELTRIKVFCKQNPSPAGKNVSVDKY